MRSTKESITLPLLRQRGEYLAIGTMFLSVGLFVSVLFALDGVRASELLDALLFLLFLTVMGGYPLLLCALRLHLVPEGAAVSLFGKTLARYPAERLNVIRWDQDQLNGPRLGRICLSTLSMAELAERRERKLRSSAYYRSGVDRRKLRGDWQETFALEQIKTMTRLGDIFPLRRGILWLQDTEENVLLLKLACPQASWADLRRKPRADFTTPPERSKRRADTPQSFRRGYAGENESAGSWLLLALFLGPTLLLMLLGALVLMVSEWAGVLIHGAAILWMFGVLGYLGVFRFGNDLVSLEEAGIRVRPKWGKERLIPAGALKTLWRFTLSSKWGPISYLTVTTFSREELARMEEERMSKTRRGREELSALKLLAEWPELAAKRRLLRRAACWGYEDRELLLMAGTAEREQWLRERYPHMETVDLTEKQFLDAQRNTSDP